jgi:hypothetical protein
MKERHGTGCRGATFYTVTLWVLAPHRLVFAHRLWWGTTQIRTAAKTSDVRRNAREQTDNLSTDTILTAGKEWETERRVDATERSETGRKHREQEGRRLLLLLGSSRCRKCPAACCLGKKRYASLISSEIISERCISNRGYSFRQCLRRGGGGDGV